MAEIQTKTEAVIRLTNEEVEEIRGWFSVIDWVAHPLAAEIYEGLGGAINDPDGDGFTVATDYGTAIFTKVA